MHPGHQGKDGKSYLCLWGHAILHTHICTISAVCHVNLNFFRVGRGRFTFKRQILLKVRGSMRKIPWRRERLPTLFLPGEFHGLYFHGVTKSWTRLSDFHFTSLQWFQLHLKKHKKDCYSVNSCGFTGASFPPIVPSCYAGSYHKKQPHIPGLPS